MATLTSRALASLLQDWRAGASGPAYLTLADRIRLLILDGRISLGSRLPSERELAHQLALSRTTVSASYASLRDAGYLDSLRGSGSVARLPHPSATPLDPAGGGELLVDFTKASLPTAPELPAAVDRAVAQLPGYLQDDGFSAYGLRHVRQAVADRYSAKGLPTDADEIMITVGAQHAIHLLGRTLLARGDRAVVESPSYPHAFESLRANGARVVPVAVSSEAGWDELELEQAFQRTSPTVAYLMPDFHNPTGRSMSVELKQRTVELAAREGTTLIIDETMWGLELDGRPLPAPFATHGRAVTLGSLGKAVWGGLRVGWIRADRELIQRIGRVRFINDLGTPIIEQLVLAELLPELDDILVRRSRLLRAGRDHLVGLLAERLPEWRVPHVQGGLTAWINLGAPVSSQLALAARNEGLLVGAGPRFGIDGVFERFLRIPFGYSTEQLDRGVEALVAAWATVMRQPVVGDPEQLAQVV